MSTTMPPPRKPTRVAWVILTQGDRDAELGAAVRSIGAIGGGACLVISNGGGWVAADGAESIELRENVGIPAGRAIGMTCADADIVCFLDDDAEIRALDMTRLLDRFDAEPDLAVAGFRLIDEAGGTARRHVPRAGRHGADVGGEVATFLGGACAIRRSAYEAVGGYWGELWYGHEELDLAWRLIDAGHRVVYAPDVVVFHPRTPIGRHATGWRLTGRNRVWIARRDLPWPIAVVHAGVWLALGLVRAPAGCRRSYLSGWWAGWWGAWSDEVERQPIRWRTVRRLGRLGRPPIV